MEHALPRRTAGIPRTWSLCMTSENHGTVGPAGCTFSHAPDKHERVLVVEVPAAAGAPVDQVNLQLVDTHRRRPVAEFKGYVDGQPAVTWLDRDNMPCVGTKLFAGAQAIDSVGDLANEASGQVAVDRALRAAQVWANEEYMCGRRMGKGEPGIHDRADAAKTECIAAILALASPVAAPAGQVAALESQAAEIERLRAELEKMWKARFMISQALHNTMVGNQSAWIEWQHGAGAEAAMAWIHNGLVGPGLIPNGKEPQPWFDANQDDRYEVPACAALSAAMHTSTQGEPKCTCPSGDGSLRWPCDAHPPAAQASKSGERQEGGVS